MSKQTIRCCQTALLVVAVLLLGTGMALAQDHPRGISPVKTCPNLPVASGAAYSCSYVITNADTLHGVTDLNVLAGPFPGVLVPIDCLQPFVPGGPSGPPVPTVGLSLGPAGSPTQSCGNDLPETAPFNCTASNINVADQVSSSGFDAGGNLGPVSGATTNSVEVLPANCDDNNACTTDTCDTVTGCANTPIVCNDNNACTADFCDPVLGCQTTPITCNDNNACTDDFCDPVLGCQTTPITCDDNNACTDDTCDPVLGCQTTPITCDDNNTCTDDTCDPVLGCVFTDNQTCNGEEICRTPGFFGSHACGLTGTCEKANSQNITLTLIEAFNAVNDPNLFICGREITNASEGNVNSALEAICVSPKGDSRLQLARQLMAAALNCILTNSGDGVDACTSLTGAVCGGVSIEGIFNACNDACADGFTTPQAGEFAGINCIDAIDCFNNGGTGIIPGPEPGENICVGDSGCHERDLDNGCVDFEPPGPAGSPKACNDARQNEVFVPIP